MARDTELLRLDVAAGYTPWLHPVEAARGPDGLRT